MRSAIIYKYATHTLSAAQNKLEKLVLGEGDLLKRHYNKNCAALSLKFGSASRSLVQPCLRRSIMDIELSMGVLPTS